MSDYDVIVLGAGPSGLVEANLAAKEGKKVLVLELTERVGGLAGNCEEIPGHINNRGAYFVMFTDKDWLLDQIGLDSSSIEFLRPTETGVAFGGEGRMPWKMYRDPAQAASYMAEAYGQETLAAYGEYMKFMAPFEQAMRMAMKNPPISMAKIMDMLPSIEAKDAARKIFYGTLQGIIDEFFPDKEKMATIRGQLFMMGAGQFYGTPNMAGSAISLIYAAATSSESVEGPLCMPKGGMGALMELFADTFVKYGGELRLNTEVTRIIIKNGVAVGVELADGQQVSADVIISSLDTNNTFGNLVCPDDMDAFFLRRVKAINYDEGIVQFYCALNKLPTYKDEYDLGLNASDAWKFQAMISNQDRYEPNFRAVNIERRVPDRLVAMSMMIGSVLDPDLAPPGKHTLTSCSNFAWPLNTPKDKVEATKEELVEVWLSTWEEVMPDVRDCVDKVVPFTPYDYNRKYHVSGGSWTHGSLRQDQLLDFRPMLGMSDYRTPFKNLYLCGTSNHPGPGVSGIAAVNCWKAIKADSAKRGKN
jgi:phytoene dehydrogenase-like protein